MTVAVLALTTLRPRGESALQTYLDAVTPLMEGAIARLVSRHKVGRRLSGNGPAEIVSLPACPSHAAVRQVFESPAYLALDQIKQSAFSHYAVCTLDPLD